MCGPPTRVPGSPKLSTFRDMNPCLSRVFSPILRIPPDFTDARKWYAVFPKTPQSAQNPGFAAIRGSGWTVPVGKGEERLTETGYHSSRNSNDLPDAPVSAPGRTISSISLILQPAPHPHLYYITRTRGADSPELPTPPSGSGTSLAETVHGTTRNRRPRFGGHVPANARPERKNPGSFSSGIWL